MLRHGHWYFTQRSSEEELFLWLRCILHCATMRQRGKVVLASGVHLRKLLRSTDHQLQRLKFLYSCWGRPLISRASWKSFHILAPQNLNCAEVDRPRKMPIHTHSHWMQLSDQQFTVLKLLSWAHAHSLNRPLSPNSESLHSKESLHILF